MVALERAVAQAGVTRTAQSLLRLNQRGGFDCPGCAWPESDKKRKAAEFCENGAKAVAEENTLRTVGAEFWAGTPSRSCRRRPSTGWATRAGSASRW